MAGVLYGLHIDGQVNACKQDGSIIQGELEAPPSLPLSPAQRSAAPTVDRRLSAGGISWLTLRGNASDVLQCHTSGERVNARQTGRGGEELPSRDAASPPVCLLCLLSPRFSCLLHLLSSPLFSSPLLSSRGPGLRCGRPPAPPPDTRGRGRGRVLVPLLSPVLFCRREAAGVVLRLVLFNTELIVTYANASK